MGKKQAGGSNHGHRTREAGYSPRFRANREIELRRQEERERERARRRKPDMVTSVQQLFHPEKK